MRRRYLYRLGGGGLAYGSSRGGRATDSGLTPSRLRRGRPEERDDRRAPPVIGRVEAAARERAGTWMLGREEELGRHMGVGAAVGGGRVGRRAAGPKEGKRAEGRKEKEGKRKGFLFV